MSEVAMGGGYDVDAAPIRHPTADQGGPWPTPFVCATAAAVAIAAATRSWTVVAVTGVAAAVASRRLPTVLLTTVLVGIAVVRSDAAWASLAPDRLGDVDGWVELAEDPKPFGRATRVVVVVDGERYEWWARGRAQQLRIDTWQAGDVVRLAGERERLDDGRARRVAWEHVVGELRVAWVGDQRDGTRLAVASNRVRDVIERGAGALPRQDAALARGLIIGDDRDQSPEMIERFRASGLAHLTAVSGQNIGLVLAAAGPLLRRARPVPRWALSLALIGWFVVLTRAEPSVLRAGAMAALGVTAFALGRPHDPVRLLALALIGLLLVDPLLAWSVGFWLSVGATAGVTVAGPWLVPRLGRLGPLALPIAVTVGAQLGVVVPSVLVFGQLSLVGTIANVVAVPVAGFVMLYGLPASLVAGTVPAVAPIVMAPVGVGVRWVDAVATVAAAAEPDPPWSWIGWAIVVLGLGALLAASRRMPESEPP